jgi:hypothetical protein
VHYFLTEMLLLGNLFFYRVLPLVVVRVLLLRVIDHGDGSSSFFAFLLCVSYMSLSILLVLGAIDIFTTSMHSFY